MAWRIAGPRINKHLLPVYPGASTVNGFFNSSDIGKLVQASSQQAVLFVGTSAAVTVNSILGILAAVPTASTPASTATPVYVQPVTRGELLDVDYSTNSTDIGSTGFVIATTNIGGTFRVAGAGTSSGNNIGAAFIDPTTVGATVAATTVGMFRLLGFSTDRKTVLGVLDSTVLAY